MCVLSRLISHVDQRDLLQTNTESEPEFVDKFTDQVLEPDSRISLKCTASGNPLPQITWTLDSLPITEAYHIRIGDFVSDVYTVNSYINISNAKSEDGGLYKVVPAEHSLFSF